MEEEILRLLAELCPDFSEYRFLEADRYKGSLFGKYNVYYKKGKNGLSGMVTGIRNEKKYGMNKFEKNFETVGNFDGSQVEYGWSGQNLLDLLKYLKSVSESKSR